MHGDYKDKMNFVDLLGMVMRYSASASATTVKTYSCSWTTCLKNSFNQCSNGYGLGKCKSLESRIPNLIPVSILSCMLFVHLMFHYGGNILKAYITPYPYIITLNPVYCPYIYIYTHVYVCIYIYISSHIYIYTHRFWA